MMETLRRLRVVLAAQRSCITLWRVGPEQEQEVWVYTHQSLEVALVYNELSRW